MDRIKKLNGSMVAAIVLSVLLIMSITIGSTLAWFASRDSANANLTMGEAVVVTIGEDYKQGNGALSMALPVDTATGGLLPGMAITPNIKVQLQKSNTNALLRARFITTVEYPDNYVDAAFADTTKYPDKGGSTQTLSGKVFETDSPYRVYAGQIYYDYYNYLGQRIDADGNKIDDPNMHTKTLQLSRVEVRQSIVDMIGQTNVNFNGVTLLTVTDADVAALEIRQRGYDLTSAINRVLSGERGMVINPSTGAPELGDEDSDLGIKYTRRVSDGWAYRQADQAWYYLGSSTNGFELQAESGYEETVTNVKIAQDITAYSETPVGGVKVNIPTYEDYAGTLSGPDGNQTDKTRNYLGTPHKKAGTITPTDNEAGVLKQASMASINTNNKNVSIDFLVKRFVLPTFIDNKYAKANVTFTFTVEAVQDYLIDPLQEATSAADRVPNNLANAILVFNNAFPQAMFPASTTAADQLAATGVTANIFPNGGTGVSWDSADGTATVTGKAILDETTTPKLSDTGIFGFGTRTDEYGDVVADYTVGANWQHGTASAIGVNPAGVVSKPAGPVVP